MNPVTNTNFDESSCLMFSSQQYLTAIMNASILMMSIVSHNAKENMSIGFQRSVDVQSLLPSNINSRMLRL